MGGVPLGGGYGERKPGYGRYEPTPYGGGLDRTQSLFRLGYGGYGLQHILPKEGKGWGVSLNSIKKL